MASKSAALGHSYAEYPRVLLARLDRSPFDVRSVQHSACSWLHHLWHNKDSSYFCSGSFSRSQGRDFLFAAKLAPLSLRRRPLLRVCAFGSGAWAASRSAFSCGLLTTIVALPTPLSEPLLDPRSG